MDESVTRGNPAYISPEGSFADVSSPVREPPTGMDWEAVVRQMVASERSTDEYEDLQQLGQGATAVVFSGIHRETGKNVAIKEYKLRLGETTKSSDEEWADVYQELAILSKCRNNNVVELLGMYVHQLDRVWAVMTYCIGSAADVFNHFKRPFREPEIAAMAYQVLNGMKYLHASKIVHRDIKCGNILISEDARAVISDFGVSRDLTTSRSGRCHTFVGSPYWIAPEVITIMATGEGHYTYTADVWSFGITLIEMATTKPPLFEMNAMSALYNIPDNDPPQLPPDTPRSRWSAAFRDMLECCLVKDPHQRPSARELCRHPMVLRVGSSGGGAIELTCLITDARSRKRTIDAEKMKAELTAARAQKARENTRRAKALSIKAPKKPQNEGKDLTIDMRRKLRNKSRKNPHRAISAVIAQRETPWEAPARIQPRPGRSSGGNVPALTNDTAV